MAHYEDRGGVFVVHADGKVRKMWRIGTDTVDENGSVLDEEKFGELAEQISAILKTKNEFDGAIFEPVATA